MLFVILTVVATAVVFASSGDDVLAYGTIGEGGAPWRLYSNGTKIVDSGHINWPYYKTWGSWNAGASHIIFTGPITTGPYLNALFGGLSGLYSIEGLHYFDTSNVVNMRRMFIDTRLESLDLSSWDTSNVTDMSFMFHRTHVLFCLDVSTWDTGNVTDMSMMFADSSIGNLNVSNWNTESVTNMAGMFFASGGPVPDLSGWNTANVTNMSMMFLHTGVTSLYISDWDTSSVTNMSHMFSGAHRITSLDLSKWDTSNVTDMSGMFSSLWQLTYLDISDWDAANVTDMRLLFANTGITNLDLSNWDTRNVQNMDGMFYISNNFRPYMRQISLGEHFNFVLSDCDEYGFDAFVIVIPPFDFYEYNCIDLPQVPTNEYYTGHWQNVGPGTTYNPQGTHVLTSDQLVATFDGTTMADTWVWQPRRTGEGEESTSRITGTFTIPNPTRPVTIELVNNAAIGRSASTAVIPPPSSANTDIHFYFDNLPPGTYSLVFSKPGHTSFTINNIVVTAAEDTNLTTDPRFPGQLPLLPGNLTGDGQINITDLNILIQNWMGTCEDANLTGSGQVNIADLHLLLQNWMAESIEVD